MPSLATSAFGVATPTLASSPSGNAASNSTATKAGNITPSTTAHSARGGNAVRKILTVIEENHSLEQMQSQMPYLSGLAHRFSYASNYTAIRHPSLPNYLAMVGGDTFGVTDDKSPDAHPITGPSVFGQAWSGSKSAKVYEESMTSNCSLGVGTTGGYAVKHNPWAYFTDERNQCSKFDVPITALSNDVATDNLPNLGFVVPNTCDDAHNVNDGCDLRTADTYLSHMLPAVLASPDFTDGALAVVVTADEDDSRGDNKVLTVVLQSTLDGTHRVVQAPLSHYSLCRLYSQIIGAAPLRNAVNAPNMAKAFGFISG